jgi:hypothetical protein
LNFKFIILVFLLSACGIKGDPTSPKDQNLPSVLDNYPGIKTQQPLDDTKIKK